MLTREEIEKLEPGRELDKLVAEYVFGCDVCEKLIGYAATSYPQYDTEPPGDYWVCQCEDGAHGDADCPDDPLCFKWIKHYSTDIAAAWLVVEAMEAKGFWFQLHNVVPNSDPIVYEVRFNGFYTCQDTASAAICIAALLAAAAKGGAG